MEFHPHIPSANDSSGRRDMTLKRAEQENAGRTDDSQSMVRLRDIFRRKAYQSKAVCLRRTECCTRWHPLKPSRVEARSAECEELLKRRPLILRNTIRTDRTRTE